MTGSNDDKEAGRPLGYGNVESRPPVDGAPTEPNEATSAGKAAGGGESGGGAYPNKAGSQSSGEPGQAYSGPDHAARNAVTPHPADDDKDATRDRTS